MRVKVGDTWFEATVDQPIAIELTPDDRKNIGNMPSDMSRYACFHDETALEYDDMVRYVREKS